MESLFFEFLCTSSAAKQRLKHLVAVGSGEDRIEAIRMLREELGNAPVSLFDEEEKENLMLQEQGEAEESGGQVDVEKALDDGVEENQSMEGSSSTYSPRENLETLDYLKSVKQSCYLLPCLEISKKFQQMVPGSIPSGHLFYRIVASNSHRGISKSDLTPILYEVINRHPSLSFFRPVTECHLKYVETVLVRIFAMFDPKNTGYITLRSLKHFNPSLGQVLLKLESMKDINDERLFFSYEHYYVLFCKFWDLDRMNPKGVLSKGEFEKFEGQITKLGVERIFGANKECIDFSDFVRFLLAFESPGGSLQNLEYLFNLVAETEVLVEIGDLVRVITPGTVYEFFKEIRVEGIKVSDFISQMWDVFKPIKKDLNTTNETSTNITFMELMRAPKLAGIFLCSLISPVKLIAFEQREVSFSEDFNDWDRYASREYAKYI
jgi:Ca2+-binding EF-hand superfamily protein